MYSNNEASLVIERLNQLLKTDSDKKLAVAVGVSTPTVSSWRQRNSTPYEICLRIAKEKGIDLNWLLTGEGTMYRNPPKEPQVLTTNKRFQAMLSIMQDLPDSEQEKILSAAEDKKFIYEMRQQRQSA